MTTWEISVRWITWNDGVMCLFFLLAGEPGVLIKNFSSTAFLIN